MRIPELKDQLNSGQCLLKIGPDHVKKAGADLVRTITSFKMSNEEENHYLNMKKKMTTTTMMATQPILSNLEDHQHQGPQEKKFQ